MPTIKLTSPVKSAQFDAVIIRADGTRENLGTIAYYHRNPLRRWWGNLKMRVARMRR